LCYRAQAIQSVEAHCCNLGVFLARLKLYRVLRQIVVTWELVLQGLAHCCNLGYCAAGLKLYRVLRQIVVTWELVLQSLSYAGS